MAQLSLASLFQDIFATPLACHFPLAIYSKRRADNFPLSFPLCWGWLTGSKLLLHLLIPVRPQHWQLLCVQV